MTAKAPSRRDVALAWLPALAYMLLIWLLSSFELPTFPTSFVPLRDKGVHALEYGALGFLLAHACLRTWRWRLGPLRIGAFAVLFGVLWGVLDEIHQAFVPGRSADVLDVVADAVGVTVGTVARILVSRLRAAPSTSERTPTR